MSHSTRWPHDVKSINGQRETFNTIVATIKQVHTNFGTGYSFEEDTTVDDKGYSPIWNMQGAYVGGRRESYEGPVYQQGDKVEVDLSLNPGRGSKIFYDIKRCVKVGSDTPVTKTQSLAPAEATTSSTGVTLDARISKGMAFNNLTVAIAHPEEFFDTGMDGKLTDVGVAELVLRRKQWFEALEDAMEGKTPFTRDADKPAEAPAKPAEKPAVAEQEEEPANPLDELVESVPWDTEEDIDSLKQKAVALMTSKWDSPIDAGDELRNALDLPQDWSGLDAGQWKQVIEYAEAKS